MTILEKIHLSFLRAIIHLVCIIPYGSAVAIGRSFGRLASLLLPFHMKLSVMQVRATLGIDDAEGFMRKVFMNQGELYVDAIRTAYMTDDELKAYVDFQGRQHFEQARASGRNIMIISPHMNWEVLGNTPRILDEEICVMADYIKSRVVQAITDEIRARYRIALLPPKGGMVKNYINQLKTGHIVGMIIDQRGKRKDRLFCDVLGLPAPTNPAPAFIALKGDAVILPLYGFKEGDRFIFRFSKPIDARDFGNDYQEIDSISDCWKSSAIRDLSNAMHAWVSSTVREKPDQWFWLHCRWARRDDMKKIIRQGGDFREFVLSQAKEYHPVENVQET
ncbi:MAG: lysophospholipid acyltransferase family protein [Deltaproteobacteria bacterium]|nr:lysophospholipid acyltransferase family protein [Deltaproteobacteria bacterium]